MVRSWGCLGIPFAIICQRRAAIDQLLLLISSLHCTDFFPMAGGILHLLTLQGSVWVSFPNLRRGVWRFESSSHLPLFICHRWQIHRVGFEPGSAWTLTSFDSFLTLAWPMFLGERSFRPLSGMWTVTSWLVKGLIWACQLGNRSLYLCHRPLCSLLGEREQLQGRAVSFVFFLSFSFFFWN